MIRNSRTPLWSFSAVLVVLCSCHTPDATANRARQENSIAIFLNGAERQSETHAQRLEIQRALHDMLDKPPDDLRRMRYANYAGQPGAWSITELLRHYFVPPSPVAIDARRFFSDV